jgi:hypothetical protein
VRNAALITLPAAAGAHASSGAAFDLFPAQRFLGGIFAAGNIYKDLFSYFRLRNAASTPAAQINISSCIAIPVMFFENSTSQSNLPYVSMI